MNSELKHRVALAIRISAIGLFAAGLGTCISWLAGVPDLTLLIQSSAQIQFVTALSFCFGAAGLMALASGRPAWALYPGALLLFLGAASLAEYATASSFMLDTWFPAAPPTALNPFPGRMAASTALALMLSGLTHCVLARGSERPWLLGATAMLSAFVISIGVETIIGYAMALPTAFVWADQVGMALLTAICVAVLGAATIMSVILVSRAEHLSALPWLAATVGVALAGLTGLLGQAVIAQYAPAEAPGAVYAMLALGLFVSVMVAATLAQVRHASLQTKALTRINNSLQQALDQRQIFMALVENSSDFIGIATPSGLPTYVNPAGRRLVGLPPEIALETTRIPEYYAPEQRQFATDVIMKSVVERGHWKGETVFRHWQNEAAIPVSDEHFAIRDSISGRLLGIGTVTRDISQLTAAKKEAAAAAERLRLAHDELSGAYEKTRELAATLELERDRLNEAQAARHVGSWDFDLRHHTLTWSAEAYRILGLDPAATLPSLQAFLERIHSEDRDRVEQVRAAALAGEGTFNVEYRLRRSDGRERLILEIGRVFCDQDGHQSRCVGTICDVTEERRAGEALRQAAAVFAATNEAIVITDAQCRITRVNPAFSRITGYGFDDVNGLNPRAWSSGRHDREFYEGMWASITTTGQWQGEIWNRRKSGEVYPTWENISVVRDDQGRVSHYVAIFSDISAIKTADERIVHLAHHDPLTGLPNRLLFSADLDQAMARARRHGQKVALFLLDLDRFKLVNDTLGHAAGDTLLRLIATRLQQRVRQEDTVARLGGDEFAIIVNEIDGPEDAIALAVKIIAAVAEPLMLMDREIETSTSIGISLFPTDAASAEDLVKSADAAMYRAKGRGRNTYHFYSAEMHAEAMTHLAIEADLRKALARGELELYYQPQVALASGRVIGVEALLRWHHPTRGMVYPDEFIPLAEESGLIEPLGVWVFDAAVRQASRWSADGFGPLRLAVNVSGRQIVYDHIVRSLSTALDRYPPLQSGVALEFEITESVLLSHERCADAFRRIKECGVSIAIDDFGIGYSSLSRLKHLAVDTVKIDRAFVCNLPDAPDDRAITAAIIAMAHGLGLNVVAEGVENEAQMTFLRDHQCDEVQGFAISKAVDAASLTAMLRRQLDLPLLSTSVH